MQNMDQKIHTFGWFQNNIWVDLFGEDSLFFWFIQSVEKNNSLVLSKYIGIITNYITQKDNIFTINGLIKKDWKCNNLG